MNFVIVDLGFGDSGKGILTSTLAYENPSTSLVVRYTGGCQSAHNVVLKDGRHHTFSQFGSATMQGIPTYIGKEFLFSPNALVREALQLAAKGVRNPLTMITVDSRARMVTPFHAVLNRVQEMSRSKDGKKHGSCGVGIGVAVEFAELVGDMRLVAEDLRDASKLNYKISILRDWVISRCRLLGVDVDKSEYASVFEAEYSEELLKNFQALGRNMVIQEGPPAEINQGHVIFEGSQGMLLDETFGFAPNNTWSDITVKHARTIIDEYCADGSTCFIPVIRTFMTRHGAGPLPSQHSSCDYGPEPHNNTNNWQDHFRFGFPDFVLWRYALLNSGIPHGADCNLFITHMDKFERIQTQVQYYEEISSGKVTRNIPTGMNSKQLYTNYIPKREAFPEYASIDKDAAGLAKYANAAQFYATSLFRGTGMGLKLLSVSDSPVTRP